MSELYELYPFDEQNWDDLTPEEQMKANYDELLSFARNIQQMLDDNPYLVDEICCCSPADHQVGWFEVICDIHTLPGILKRIDEHTVENTPNENAKEEEVE